MVSIDNIIYNTLLSWKTVNLPKVGSLRLDFAGAKQTGNKLIPPSTTVVFSRKRIPDGEDILDLIVAQEKCDFTQAREMYNKWLGNAEGYKLRIDGVGMIDNKTFVPTKELFTLLNQNRDPKETEGKGKKKSSRWVLVTILIAALVIILLLAGYYCGWYRSCCTSASVVADTLTTAVVEAPDVTEVVPGVGEASSEELIAESLKEEVRAEEGKDTAAVTAPAPHDKMYRYYVVAGVFSIEGNAGKYVAQIKKCRPQLDPEKIALPDGRTMVVIYGSDSKAEAQKVRRKNLRVNEALWVWENK